MERPETQLRPPRGDEVLADHLRSRRVRAGGLTVVGIDGRSGAGKSTLAAAVASRLGGDDVVAVIEGDQFYAGGSAETWDRRTPVERADQVIEWRRQHDVLAALRDRGVAEWRAFDWNATDWDVDPAPLAEAPIRARAGSMVLLEGAYSCRPQLHELLDVRVLLVCAPDVRRQQLLDREGEAYRADWEARWSAAEDYYFTKVMPPERFDLVVDAADSVGSAPALRER